MLREDWEFNVLDIYNYHRPGRLQHYMDFIVEHHNHTEGDICEMGVFRGRSILATGLLLKNLGSPKQVFGYDSFQGLPEPCEKDDFIQFERLFAQGKITKEHLAKTRCHGALRSFVLRAEVTPMNISTYGGNFSGTDIEDLERKIRLLELDNVHLVKGPFSETMVGPRKFMAVLLDCDLYESYRVALPFVWERLSPSGYIYLDEYYSLKFAGARIACDEFFDDKTDKPFQHKQQPGEFERWGVRKSHV